MERTLADEQLIAQAREGDATAYVVLIRDHQDVILHTTMLITGHPWTPEEELFEAWRALGPSAAPVAAHDDGQRGS